MTHEENPNVVKCFGLLGRYISYQVNEFAIAYAYMGMFKDTESKNLNDAKGIIDNAHIETDRKTFDQALASLSESLGENDYKDIVRHVLNLDKRNYSASFPLTDPSSDGIAELAIRLLDIKDGDRVLDLGSGVGFFIAKALEYACEEKQVIEVSGIELQKNYAMLSNLCLSVLSGIDREYAKVSNVIYLNPVPTCTKGFSYPPLNIRALSADEFIGTSLGINLTLKNTMDWVFIDKLLSSLDKDDPSAKAVAICSLRALYNDDDKEYRDTLVSKGFLEGVIELPSGALTKINCKSCMLVFSKGNKSVKVVDASGVFESQKKRSKNPDLPVEKILEDYRSSEVKRIPSSMMPEYGNWMPESLLIKRKKLRNGVRLEEVAEVAIGSQYSAKDFQEVLTDKKTGCRILTSGDIEDGHIKWDSLKSIRNEDMKFDKHVIRKGDLIVTSKSSKVKIAVVDIEPADKVLVTGGMLLVRPDQKKINPTYLKIYLDSEDGKNAIKSIQKGDIVVSMTAKDFKRITIPLIPLERQNSYAIKYCEIVEQIKEYVKKVEDLQNKLDNYYSEIERDGLVG